MSENNMEAAAEKLNECLYINNSVDILSFLFLIKHYKNYDKHKNCIGICNRLKTWNIIRI